MTGTEQIFTDKEELLQKILDTTQTMIFWKDADRRFRGANQAFLDYYGLQGLEDIQGKTDEDMGWHSDPDPYKNDELRVLQGESTYMVYGKCLARGEERDILASKKPLWKNGKIVGLVGSFIDVSREYRQRDNITQLLQDREELKASRQIFEDTLRTAKMVMWEYDIPHKRVTVARGAANAADWAKFGLPQVIENVPESLMDRIDEADRLRFAALYRAVAAGRDASGDFWYQDRPGQETRCERIIYTVVKDTYGNPIKAYGIGRNVTAEKKVEDRYAQELDYLRHNTDYNLLGKTHCNLTHNAVLSYEFAEQESFRRPSRDLTYDEGCVLYLDTLYREEDRKPLGNLLNREKLIRRFRQGEQVSSLQYRRKQQDKAPIWVTTVVRTYMSPDTGDIECFVYTYDVSEKALEQQIMSKLAVLGYDELGVVYVKTGMWKCYRFRREPGNDTLWESNGAYADDLHRYLQDEALPEEREQALQGLKLQTVVQELARQKLYVFAGGARGRDGSLRQKQFQFAYMDEKEDTLFYCMTDVTGQFKKEKDRIAELQDAKLSADAANQAKSSFLSSMSHDLRTPLNGIIGFTELALGVDNPEQKQDYLRKIKLSGELLLDLVNDTLELSRIESGKLVLKPEVVDGKDFWESVVTALRPSAKMKNIKLVSKGEDYPREMLRLDPVKTKRVLLNLISNAIKYTPAGGTVQVEIQKLQPPVQGCTWRLIVQDTGIGMSREFLPRIFEPFSQEHRPEAENVTGTGLGLAIVKRIVDVMGGSIKVESKLQVGTRFTVDLPLEHWSREQDGLREQQKKEERKQRDIAAILAGKNVLLCEDNYLNAEIAQLLLKEKQVQVDWAKNGKEGVEKFKASLGGYYDAVLMDIRMPVLDGYGALAALRKLPRPDGARVPVIAMTADAFEEDIRKAEQAGFKGYVTKPVQPEQLYQVLAQALLQAQTLSQAQ